ncbi:hypothetical protein [Verminephrobacter eiseniae]|uniref:hypothetical protein n=1 Tax=Verminephrobacter eiseniae TaxID=364317 RepID=UPI002237C14F|nr:hypothetical protein [Verminephrobacter eiseniae]
MNDLLVSSYFSILGAMCGCALLRAMMKVDYRYLSFIILFVAFTSSLTMAAVTAGAWDGFTLLTIVALSFICTLAFYLAYISQARLTDEYLKDPWGRRVLGVILFCFALFLAYNIVGLTNAFPQAMIDVKWAIKAAMLLGSGVVLMGTAGMAMIVHKEDMSSAGAGRNPITHEQLLRDLIVIVAWFLMTFFIITEILDRWVGSFFILT